LRGHFVSAGVIVQLREVPWEFSLFFGPSALCSRGNFQGAFDADTGRAQDGAGHQKSFRVLKTRPPLGAGQREAEEDWGR
jgi:hypothetical protein